MAAIQFSELIIRVSPFTDQSSECVLTTALPHFSRLDSCSWKKSWGNSILRRWWSFQIGCWRHRQRDRGNRWAACSRAKCISLNFICLKLQNVFVSNCSMYLSQIAKGICFKLQNIFVSNFEMHLCQYSHWSSSEALWLASLLLAAGLMPTTKRYVYI